MTLPRLSAPISGLYAGRAAERWDGKPPSAIGKTAVDGRARLGYDGLDGDEQADRSAHGGPDKALHHYPADHIAAWAADLPESADRFRPGGFGENISTTGITEADLCIGDVIEVGGCVIQVSHGRQPCWKFAAHMGREDFAYRVRKTGRTGWYYRVLTPGEVGLCDMMRLVERPQPDWTLARVITAHFDPKLDASIASALADLPELAAAWRADFAKKAGGRA